MLEPYAAFSDQIFPATKVTQRGSALVSSYDSHCNFCINFTVQMYANGIFTQFMDGAIRHANFAALNLHLNLFKRLDNIDRTD
jgi:hypothetical protein